MPPSCHQELASALSSTTLPMHISPLRNSDCAYVWYLQNLKVLNAPYQQRLDETDQFLTS